MRARTTCTGRTDRAPGSPSGDAGGLPPGRGRRGRATLLGAAALFLLSAPLGESAPADTWHLYRALMDAYRMELVFPEAARSPWIEELAEKAQRSTHLEQVTWGPVPGSADPAGGADPLDRSLRVVLGAAGDAHMSAIAEALGVESVRKGDREGFSFADQNYLLGADALIACLEDPERPGQPLVAYLGNDVEILALYVDDLTPVWRPGFSTWRGGGLERRGRLGSSGVLLPDSVEDFRQRRTSHRTSTRVARNERIQFYAPPSVDLAQLKLYQNTASRALDRIESWLPPASPVEDGEADGRPGQAGRHLVQVYGSGEEMLAAANGQDLFRLNPITSTVNLLLAPPMPHDGGAGIAASAAVKALGRPASLWLLDGAPVEAADSWWGRPLRAWVAYLEAAGVTPDLELLIDPHSGNEITAHVLAPLRAFLFRMLRRRHGDEYVARLWVGEEQLEGDLAELESSYREFLAENLKRYEAEIAGWREMHRSRVASVDFRRGVHFTGSGRDANRGYGSRAAKTSLEQASQLGVDAISVSTFAWEAQGFPEHVGGSGHRGRPGFRAMDSDVALAATVADARALGLTVMLQPRLLASASGNLYASLDLTAEGELEAFFDAYERFIVHYALLAELGDCEILCIGAGMPRISRRQTEDLEGENLQIESYRIQRWEQAVDLARRSFSGGLTYAAMRGGREVGDELLGFASWGKMDFIGLDSYEPVCWECSRRPPDHSCVSRLRNHLMRALKTAEEYGLPLLITGAGFTSTESAWRRPWMEQGELDLDEQRRLYEAMAEALASVRAESTQLRGIYLWEWSTEPEAGGASDRHFTPQNKPAEAVLGEMFRSL